MTDAKNKKLVFEEITKGFTTQEAIREAKRCLRCKVPSCVKGCPIENDIPDFIQQLSMGNIGNALHIINQKSNLPAICGRVCAHEKQCEGNCVLGVKGKPVKIGKLERFIADFDGDMGLIREKIGQKNRGKVAVIGSGPAGLTVAGDLAREGFNVIIYEGEQELGGVLMFGIPQYRLPKAIVRREIERIAALGVSFITSCMVGRDITVDDMFKSGFDAVFIGTGTAIPKSLDIPGENLIGVTQSSYFLRMVSLHQGGSIGKDHVPIRKGDRVFIIGAGNVAMDAARTALRMGAGGVTVISNQGEEDITALRTEYEEALSEGVQFLWNTCVKELLGAKKRLQTIVLETPGGEAVREANRLMLAIGSRPANRIVSTTEGIGVDDTGYVITKERPYGMTTKRGVFAGGDVVHTPQTVVLAMREAKQVAKGIAQFVDAKKLLEEV